MSKDCSFSESASPEVSLQPSCGTPVRWVRLVVVLLLSFYLIGVFTKKFDLDEWQTMVTAAGVAGGGLLYTDIWDNHGPLLTVAIGSVMKVADIRNHAVLMFGARLGMFIFMAATLWLTGRLARRICPSSSLAGPLAMAVLLFSQTFFKKGFEIRPDVPLLTVWTTCLFLFLRGFEHNRVADFGLAGLVLGLGFAFSVKTLLLGVACAIGFLVVQLQQRRFQPGQILAFGIGASVAPALMLMGLNAAGNLQTFFHSYIGQNFDRVAEYWLKGLEKAFKAEALLLLLALTAILPAVREWRKGSLPEGIAVLSAVWLTMLVLYLRLPTHHPQSLLPVWPAAAVVIAWALDRLWAKWSSEKKWRPLFYGFFLALTIISSADYGWGGLESTKELKFARQRMALLPPRALLFDANGVPLFQPRPFIYKVFVGTLCERVRHESFQIDIPAGLDRLDVPYAGWEGRVKKMGEKVKNFLSQNYLPLKAGNLLAAGTVLEPAGSGSVSWRNRIAGQYYWQLAKSGANLLVDGLPAGKHIDLKDGSHTFSWKGNQPLILSVAPPSHWSGTANIFDWKTNESKP